jgi:hypothetical protein
MATLTPPSAALARQTETVSSEAISTSDCAMEVVNTTPTSGTSGRSYVEMSTSNFCAYYTSSIGYLTDVSPGTVAAQLMLTQSTATANGGFADTRGSIVTNLGAQMAYIQSLDPSFDYFGMANSPNTWPPDRDRVPRRTVPALRCRSGAASVVTGATGPVALLPRPSLSGRASRRREPALGALIGKRGRR